MLVCDIFKPLIGCARRRLPTRRDLRQIGYPRGRAIGERLIELGQWSFALRKGDKIDDAED